MNDYSTVKLLGPKGARKVEAQHDGLVRAREIALMEGGDSAHIEMIQEAILSCRAQLSGMSLVAYKNAYCFEVK